MFDAVALTLVGLTFLLAGCVKGVIGLGIPTVSLAVLTATIGLAPAMALLLVPSLLTNLWQATAGGHTREVVLRLWPFLLAAGASVWVGALALRRVEISSLAALLGLLLVLYSVLSLSRLRLSIPRRWEKWLGPVVGATNGVLTGMTGSFVVPGVLYLQALGMPRDLLIQAMGMLFSVSTVALAVSLGGYRLLSLELALVSLAATVPALFGMALGRRLRLRLSEEKFRRVFFLSLLALGVYIVIRSGG